MERKTRIDAIGAASLIAFSALLGLNQVLIKIVNGGLQPVFQAGLRSLVALPFLVIFALVMKRRLSISDGSLVPGILCGLLFSGEFILLFLALDFTTVARTSIFFYSMPMWVPIGAHFLIPGEGLTPVRIVGLLLAFPGVAVAFADNHSSVSDKAIYGDIMCLFGAVMWAAIALLARTTNLSKANPQMQLVYQLVVSAPIMLFASLYFGPWIRELQPFHLAIFSFQSIVVVAFGFSFWFWLLSKYPSSDMASFGFLAPVFGVALGWLVLGEPVGWKLVAALVLVGAGIVLVNRKPKPVQINS